MELTSLQEKIKKESGTAFFIAKIASYVSVAVAALFLILVVATGISPGVNHPSPETAFKDVLISSAPWIFSGIFVGIVSIFASKLFHEICNNYTPFSEKNTRILKSIAITTTMMGCALLVFDFVSTFVMDFDIKLSAFTIVYVLMGLVFGLFARIFDYGRQLQQESDETL